MSMDPLGVMRLHWQMSMMLTEAAAVIWMRSLGMAGLWPVTGSENGRMIREKQTAFARAGQAAMLASLRGQGPDKVAAAALGPIRRTTRLNASRLSKRAGK